MHFNSSIASDVAVQRGRDKSRAPRTLLAAAAVLFMAASLFAVGWRRVEASGSAAQSSKGVSAASLANYPVIVHVTGSYLNWHEGLNTVDVTIDSVKYKLVMQGTIQVIAIGDYHARLVAPNKAPAAYIANREYEFIFPDGKTMQFQLCGEWQQ